MSLTLATAKLQGAPSSRVFLPGPSVLLYRNSDSRAALMALTSHSYTSKRAWDRHEALKTLAVNSSTVVGVRTHGGKRKLIGSPEKETRRRS